MYRIGKLCVGGQFNLYIPLSLLGFEWVNRYSVQYFRSVGRGVRRAIRVLIALTFLLGLEGCAGFNFFRQAAAGQMDLLQRAQPIDEVLANPGTPPALATKLKLAVEIRRFASERLQLPDNAAYTRYTDVGRPYVVWNVIATPALSLQPEVHCFPFAGCVPYRGYHLEADAKREAAALQQQGLDVYLYGVPAYSTLGWFDDPLLSTVLGYGEADLARLIFHELAHQVAYVAGDSAFNEAFATAVELEGIELWLAQRQDALAFGRYQLGEQRRAGFHRLMRDTRQQLAALYATDQPAEAKRLGKLAVLQDLSQRYQQLKREWGGYGGYDGWFDPPPNNAHFSILATYHDKVPALRRLFQQEGRDFARFYQRIRMLTAMSQAGRDAELARLAEGLPVELAPSAAVQQGDKQ